VFSTALGPANVDRILSFETVDVIALSRAVFSTLAPGTTLAAGAFAAGAGLVAARDASDRIVYDTATGALRYDADGAGGAAAVQVATLQNKPAFLNQSDFLIIA
jgi:Ca2+-binding RTX toxin-like protein